MKRQPFLHDASVAWIELLANARGFQRLDALLWKFDNEFSSGGDHREDLAIHLQR